MRKLRVRLNSINESIITNWFWLHIIFIAFFILYVLYKVMKGVNPIYSVAEKPYDFNLLSFIFIIIPESFPRKNNMGFLPRCGGRQFLFQVIPPRRRPLARRRTPLPQAACAKGHNAFSHAG